MIIPSVLTQDQISKLEVIFKELRWLDGKKTAGALAGSVKDNEQADLTDRRGAEAARTLLDALKANPMLQAAALPKRYSALRLSRTTGGGSYGAHFDNAIMSGREGSMRSDLSFTLFLSSPDDYDGGALKIYGHDADITHKLPAGDLILYPSGAMHEVTPVTRGRRIVCAGWIQSLVRDTSQRSLLLELKSLGADLQERLGADAAETHMAQKLHADLMRRWVDL